MRRISLVQCPYCSSSSVYVCHRKKLWERIAFLFLLRLVRCHACFRHHYRPLFIPARGWHRFASWELPCYRRTDLTLAFTTSVRRSRTQLGIRKSRSTSKACGEAHHKSTIYMNLSDEQIQGHWSQPKSPTKAC